jgi:hypothetical protein
MKRAIRLGLILSVALTSAAALAEGIGSDRRDTSMPPVEEMQAKVPRRDDMKQAATPYDQEEQGERAGAASGEPDHDQTPRISPLLREQRR